MFVFVMAAIGLFVLRALVARPLVRSVEGMSLKPLSIAFEIAAGLGLIAIPCISTSRPRTIRCARCST
jgi:hypothetical protein